jgi:hypothetical protein
MPKQRGGLLKYGHVPMVDADHDFKAGQHARYRVTTINWTFATENGKQNHAKVHRNVYSFTLRNLIKFACDLESMGGWRKILS